MGNLEAPFTLWQVGVDFGGSDEFIVPASMQGVFVVRNVILICFSVIAGEHTIFYVNDVPVCQTAGRPDGSACDSYQTFFTLFGGDVLFCIGPSTAGGGAITVGGYYSGTGSE